jgi:hypothetical protein
MHRGGDGSTNNYVGIGFWANDDILNVVATGWVGVGTNNPGQPLHLHNAANAYFRISSPNGVQKAIEFYDTTNSASRWIQYVPGGSTDLRFYVSGFGDVFTMYAGGGANLSGTLTVGAVSGVHNGGAVFQSGTWYNDVSTGTNPYRFHFETNGRTYLSSPSGRFDFGTAGNISGTIYCGTINNGGTINNSGDIINTGYISTAGRVYFGAQPSWNGNITNPSWSTLGTAGTSQLITANVSVSSVPTVFGLVLANSLTTSTGSLNTLWSPALGFGGATTSGVYLASPCYIAANIYNGGDGNWRGGDLAFFTAPSTTGGERMRICGNGNVGIGTTTPSSTLDVNGTLSLNSSATISRCTNNGTISVAGYGGNTWYGYAINNGTSFMFQSTSSGAAGNGGIWQPGATGWMMYTDGSGHYGFGYGASSMDTSYNVTLCGSTRINDGAKIIIQNGVNGTSARGLQMWSASDYAWAIYMATSGGGVSFANGTACSSGSGITSHAIRFRVYGGATNGFIFENGGEGHLFSIRASDGCLSMANGVWHVSNDGYRRFHFGAASTTYYESGNGTHMFRNNTDVDSTGTIYCGDVYAASDARLKTEVRSIENPLDMIDALDGVSYRWRRKEELDTWDGTQDATPQRNYDTKRHVGFLAQDVKKVLPEVVSEDDNGYLSINYGNVVALLVEGIKELRKENRVMKDQIAQLMRK